MVLNVTPGTFLGYSIDIIFFFLNHCLKNSSGTFNEMLLHISKSVRKPSNCSGIKRACDVSDSISSYVSKPVLPHDISSIIVWKG